MATKEQLADDIKELNPEAKVDGLNHAELTDLLKAETEKAEAEETDKGGGDDTPEETVQVLEVDGRAQLLAAVATGVTANPNFDPRPGYTRPEVLANYVVKITDAIIEAETK